MQKNTIYMAPDLMYDRLEQCIGCEYFYTQRQNLEISRLLTIPFVCGNIIIKSRPAGSSCGFSFTTSKGTAKRTGRRVTPAN